MFIEIIFEGIKKFAGEIVGVVLLIIAWKKFPGLRALFGQYKSLKNDGDNNKHSEQEIKKLDESKPPIMSDKDFVNLCKSGNVSEIEEALKNGADVNAKSNKGVTALMVAASNGQIEVAELLIKHGADVNSKSNGDRTALMCAERNGHSEAANLLRSYGAK